MRELIIFLISLILGTWLHIFFFEELLNVFAYNPPLALLSILCGFLWVYFTLSSLYGYFGGIK